MKLLPDPFRLSYGARVSEPDRTTKLLERLDAASRLVPKDSIRPPVQRLSQYQRKFR